MEYFLFCLDVTVGVVVVFFLPLFATGLLAALPNPSVLVLWYPWRLCGDARGSMSWHVQERCRVFHEVLALTEPETTSEGWSQTRHVFVFLGGGGLC